MIYAAPGASFEARVEGFATGLTGTVGVRLLDNVGGTTTARVTAGIIENPASSGSYVVTMTAPAGSGQYAVFWDTGTVSPTTTASEDLTVTPSGYSTTTASGTWSYNATTLASSTKDQIRLEVGDNVAGRTVTLADEEITFAVSKEANNWGAAARCCEMLSRQYLSKADTRLGRSLSLTYTTQAAQFAEMAKGLRRKAVALNVPWVGGQFVSDKQAYAENDLLVQPLFARDMQESPWAGSLSSDAPDATGGDDED